jgi:predicted nucleic acid-binding protein
LTAVADTNVVAALLLRRAENPDVTNFFARDPDWRVPSLWRSEFRHVLLKHVRSNLLTSAQALAVWSRALTRLESKEHMIDGHQVLDLAIRFGCSTYDAEYVVLAKELNCSLLTFDRKLLQLFPEVAVKPGS